MCFSYQRQTEPPETRQNLFFRLSRPANALSSVRMHRPPHQYRVPVPVQLHYSWLQHQTVQTWEVGLAEPGLANPPQLQQHRIMGSLSLWPIKNFESPSRGIPPPDQEGDITIASKIVPDKNPTATKATRLDGHIRHTPRLEGTEATGWLVTKWWLAKGWLAPSDSTTTNQRVRTAQPDSTLARALHKSQIDSSQC